MSVIVLGSLALLALFVWAIVWRMRTAKPEVKRTHTQPAPEPERVSILGRGIVVEGTLTVNDPLRIDGVFRGDIDAIAPLSIGATGRVDGDVRARELVVAGEIGGDISAEKLALEETARVTGDVACSSIRVEDGAWFRGRVTMKREEIAEESHATTA
ncbi:MAG TPA: polymer-forming cytoskeletal protein [Thermoanaerobaculia bacterium]|nr:polymer-forming cytoskeletal protein [Thermoanaerobaculia bacterium]